eukprot:CAMPEP_0175141314 /NCGR_PEP_ID=MMETSP0087-20121206/12038_1 /TAXON_ID=136419 /ORGANISM="Unknown Unknown, Strain D1" /LENGTH=329 /DNA_ID=CAMNT_0016424719 /DNA_START=32 /DNA_END=1021 /DNA_ORIENTATION=-
MLQFALLSLSLLSSAFGAEGPCDIFDAAGSPCVAAHSTIRALYNNFSGSLYQVKRLSDKATKDIGVLSAGGFANAATQDAFCGISACVIQRIYDQSPQKNHLDTAPPGGAHKSPDAPVNATRHQLTVGGHKVYGAYFEGNMGYRCDKTSKVATGDAPESIYMVTAGKHYNGGCCFDYGNAEVDNLDDGAGTMEALYFGNSTGWGRGGGNGPWIMADLENGLWAGNEKVNPQNTAIEADFVTAMVKGRAGGFSLKGANAQTGGLRLLFDGPRPDGYNPMKKQGAIILGIGGDNSAWAVGTFYEGAMTSGFSSDSTDEALQANIVAAGYGK